MIQMPPCIVLAGGLGTRLSSVLGELPKCLAPVGERTFLDIQLETLSTCGITSFILSLGHAAKPVLDLIPVLNRFYDVQSIVERERLGTGGAMLFAMNEIGLDECLVINGDTLLDADLVQMLVPLDRSERELIRLATFYVPNRSRYGGLNISKGRVMHFLEKGNDSPGPINAGLYRISRESFGVRIPGSFFSFELDILPELVANGAVCAVRAEGSFIDIGVPEDYQQFCNRYI
jgi:D-glycero-alpha-D-manno-heptose 1-phosphate guanylyltransferase